MKRIKIKKLLQTENEENPILVKGWIRTKRNSKGFSFLEVNDGSCLKNIQIVVDASLANYAEVEKLTTGSAVSLSGMLVKSIGGGQKWEIKAASVEILHLAPETFPLQKKRHTDEYLRTIAHLRPRTNKYGAAFRIRSELSHAVHQFFRERDFYYIHTPILTGSDCEGAGELFRVTSLDLNNLPKSDQKINYQNDFFGKEANLTVSGQLSAEMFALALGDVYTFGPTFRAENSNTARHAAEFWMIEPEMAFCDLAQNMAFAESILKYLVNHILDHCDEDLNLFAKFVDPQLQSTLASIVTSEFIKISYADAIESLSKTKNKFEFPVEFGKDLQSEHERYLTEVLYKRPVIIYNYPKTIKPFYMRLNDDNQTVAAMDVLVPRIGEIIGGSQREERLPVLEARMSESHLSQEEYWWYLDSRRFGSVPHSGFGLGFERLMMLITGITNIRDVIPFPRTPKNIDF